MNTQPTALFLLTSMVLLGGCSSATHEPSAIAEGAVAWAGEQHKAVHDGDVGAKVRLSDLARRPHLYAVGPLEGLTGEITVLDGQPTISTIERGAFRTASSLDHGAAFFVWTYSANWKPVPLPGSVRTLEDLAAYLPDAARAAGLDARVPLAFRVDGKVESLHYHVLSPPAHTLPTFEDHEKAKVHSSVAARTVRMVGFYSTEHRGVFTPGTSDVHAHFVTDDGRFAGHVEEFELATGAVLLFPTSSASANRSEDSKR
ncbi:MAG: acetolactate decarboxylase [Phycisphaerae bacterium]|nr:acetolactate decarboxylase [Phycisphaerae bacterium]